MAPGVALGFGDVQLFCAVVSSVVELLDVVLEAPALGEGHGVAAFAVVV